MSLISDGKMFLCKSGDEVWDLSKRCNVHRDCSDGSDERDCVYGTDIYYNNNNNSNNNNNNNDNNNNINIMMIIITITITIIITVIIIIIITHFTRKQYSRMMKFK